VTERASSNSGSLEVGTDLPWIDAYLEKTADAKDAASSSTFVPPPEQEAISGAGERSWAFDEAGEHVRSLSESFPEAHPADEGSAPLASTDMPMWSSDDWTDILPLKGATAGEQEEQGTQARPPAGESDAATAADMLELLARRVRDGEISLVGFRQEMGEASALAATLTALLGRGR